MNIPYDPFQEKMRMMMSKPEKNPKISEVAMNISTLLFQGVIPED
jgi:hypothetical protein